MLNNHGWGMRNMLIYSCIILIFLLIATYYVKYLYRDLSMNDNDVTSEVQEENDTKPTKEINYDLYENYEKRMNNAAINYVKRYYNTLDTGIASVELWDLTNGGYIETLYDQVDNSKCLGYANVWDTEDGELKASSYIKCPSYTTEGYVS
jgi:hypothetical protein